MIKTDIYPRKVILLSNPRPLWNFLGLWPPHLPGISNSLRGGGLDIFGNHTISTQKNLDDIQKNAFSLAGTKIWNEKPNSLKNFSRKTFRKKPKGALLTVLDGRVRIKWYCNTVKDLLSNIVSQKDEKLHTTRLHVDDTAILHIKIKITEILLEKKLNTVNFHVPLLKIKINFCLVYTMLWFSFILGLNFIVLCFKLIFTKIEPSGRQLVREFVYDHL